MRTFLRSKVTLLFMMLGLLLAIPAIALADIVINDVVTGGNDTITVGNSTTIKYGIRAINANQEGTGGVQGCNATASTPVKVYITAPAAVTLSGSDVQTDADGIPPDGKYLEFTDCANQTLDNGQVKTATFSSSTVGNHSITHQIVENFPGNYTNSADFTLKVNDNCPGGDTSGNLQDDKCTANTAPTAVADSYSATEDQQLTVSAPGVLGNDTDAENNPLTAVLVSGPSHAAATNGFTLNQDGSFSYTPAANYNGSDSFTYKAKDSNNAESNTVTVTITVASVNDVPTCQNVAIETDEDEQGSVAANCSDADGDTLTYAIVDQAADGTASVDGSDLKYDPELNFNGSDSFTYRASDGPANSAAATVNVTVNPVNDPPPTPGAISTTSELSSDGTFTLNWGASIDVDGDNVTYTLEKRDANDANWSPVDSGLTSPSYTFGSGNALGEGTWDFRVKAVDSPAAAESDFSTAENLVKVDKSAPNAPTLSFATTGQSFKATVSGVDWYKDSAKIDVADNGDPALADTSDGSGVDAASLLPNPFSVTQNGTSTASRKVKDNATNESAAGELTVHVDAANPTFDNCQSGTFLVNSGTQSVSITASDNESGIDIANSQLNKTVDTSSTGTKTVTFTAKDKVGHSVTKNCDYTVGAYDFVGFSSPVDNQPTMNSAKAGQAIPLKWRLMNNGTPVTNLQSVTVTASSLTCSLGSTTDLLEEYASGSSGLQNLGDGYYQFNWKTPTTYVKSCKSVQINGLGMQLTAAQQPWFQFTK